MAPPDPDAVRPGHGPRDPTGPWRVEPDDLTRPEVVALLREHLAAMRAQSPAGSVHALDVERLRDPAVTFWTAWDDGAPPAPVLAGCVALRRLDATHGEIKSMRTATTHLRRGVAAALLRHVVEVATQRGYHRLSLETGSGPGFEAAHAFYTRAGFTPCEAFGDYLAGDPFNRFLTLEPPPLRR